MKTATVVGYHGRANVGDDVFLLLTAKWLAHRGIQRMNVAGFPENLPSELAGVRVHAYEKRWRISRVVWLFTLFHALRSSVLVFAAGSIFSVQPFLIAYCVLRCLRILRPKIKVVALGVSVGPFRNQKDAMWCGRLLGLFDAVVVRDSASAAALAAYGLRSNVREGYDLALLLSPPKAGSRGPRHMVGVSLTARAVKSAEDLRGMPTTEVVADALQEMTRAVPQLRVTIFEFCTDRLDGDRDIGAEFQRLLSDRGLDCEIYSYDGADPEEYLERLDECRAMIAGRMHAGVFALLRAVPTLQIGYAPKVCDLYRQCSLSTGHLLEPADITPTGVLRFLMDAWAGALDETFEISRIELQRRGAELAVIIKQLDGEMVDPA